MPPRVSPIHIKLLIDSLDASQFNAPILASPGWHPMGSPHLQHRRHERCMAQRWREAPGGETHVVLGEATVAMTGD